MSYNSKYTGAEVDAALDLANSALQEHQDLTGYQVVISDLDTIREGAAKGATALQSVPSEYVTETELTDKGYATTSAMDVALGDKVDKVDGKQLSTEDFTTALKSKLEGLSNYDDTTINAAVEKLRTDFDTLVSGDTTTAIENFNEIVAFLDGIEDSESLDSIIASIERQIAGKQDAISDLETIREGAAKGATAIQEIPSEYVTETELTAKGYATDASLHAVAKSGSYDDLSNKPTIPSAVTESTVSGWGFTKNTGTYSKPSTGIPKTDLASAVQNSLGKADTALQSYTETDPVFSASAAAGITASDITNWNGKTSNTGTVTGIKMNGVSKGTSGVVDLGTVITAHQDISGKQDVSLKFTDKTASSWTSDATYSDFPYRCDVTCSGVTSSDYAEVIFGLTEALSGEYAPICETGTNNVSIWSTSNATITIPTIIVTKL